ncbi:nitrous oxide reductase accessory protein NosL [Poritiphilus flavus]|uniref:Transporter n=1 Tax=Poritiphilus flavus TaxID=2697053 RepID=A0A6L9E7R2_9FLAO|nr:nitrous oxide reductase accessory protein NosL [Poritiphilus flavus]NAS10489.1 hypothetical protein [Poritiphilus flavus]
MKIKICFLTLLFGLIALNNSLAQSSCAYCKMDIKDERFRAQALVGTGTDVHYDAIECLINHLKTSEVDHIKDMKVTDYHSGQLIEAEKAYYLKSKAVPSPMGANLSAYSTESAAREVSEKNGGDVLSWNELKQRFANSKFGAVQDHSHHHGPGHYAPIGIMGDHLHPKGGLMVSLRYMYMSMAGNREGNNQITDEAIYQRFMVAPQQMSMQMYMLGLMYAPDDRITLMLMQNLARRDMDLTARMVMNGGMPMLRDFNTSSSGLGDLKLVALYGIHSAARSSFHLNLGLNLPVGTIDNRDATPMNPDAKLPYAMQLGSGTFDLIFGGTLKGNSNRISWGIQQLNTIRTGTNKEDYRFGNLHELHAWTSYEISGKLSSSLRISGSTEGSISGADPELNPIMVTTTDPDNYGGELLRGSLGVTVCAANSKLVIGGEVGLPLYQNYNGIFMDEEFLINAGIRYIIL